MKRLFSIVLTTSLFLSIFSSCIDDEDILDPQQQLELEKPIIEAYVRANYPNAVQYETTGLWYEILDPGTPSYEYTARDSASLNQTFLTANAVVNYTGRLVSNGTVVEQSDNSIEGDSLLIELNLNTGEATRIAAWIWAFYPRTLTVDTQELQIGWIFQNGAQPGSRFRIITPSAYAYGNIALGTIPANSPLDYEIEVLALE